MNTKKLYPNIFILGVRRSGTTIFWETLRQDKRYVCFDEPFNPHLFELPKQNKKKTRDEFIDLYNQSPDDFKEMFSPIYTHEEHVDELSSNQEKYLKWLICKSGPVIIDFTRCNFKIESLYKIDPDAMIIHLVRDWREVTISHILTRTSKKDKLVVKIKMKMKEKCFWRLKSRCDGYGLQTIYKNLFKNEDAKDKKSYEQVARVCNASVFNVEKEGRKYYKNNFSTLCLIDFISSPEEIVCVLYKKWNIKPPNINYAGIKKLSIHKIKYSKKWDEIEKKHSFPKTKTDI
jgi:hypothetical protein